MTEAAATAPQAHIDPSVPSSSTSTGFLQRLLAWGREKAPETRAVWREPEPPPHGAPFEDYMAFYRSQHTTKGIRATHLVGIPGAAAALPILAVRPKVGAKVFLASWLLQVAGHRIFEGNSPALSRGFFTYQFCGLAFWCEEMGDLAAGR